MNIFFSIFESVGVLLCLGCIGFYIIGKRIIPGNVLGLLSPLVLDIALPSLIFVSIINRFTLGEFSDWWTLPLWWIGFSVAAITLTLITMFLSRKETRREFAISLFYQNGIFFPLAVITGLYGSDSTHLVSLFLFISFHPALFFSTYHFFFSFRTSAGSALTASNSSGSVTISDANSGVAAIDEMGSGSVSISDKNSGADTADGTGSDTDSGAIAGHQLDWKKIIHPVLIMTIIALLIRLADVQNLIPGFIIKQLSLLGGMTLPLIMIILGGNIYLDFQKKGRFQAVEIMKFVLVKNFLFPLVFLGGLILIRPPYHIALIILLQSAVPPISAIPIVTERCGGNASIVNQFIFSSYIVLLISIPIMVSLFTRFFPAP